MASTRFDWGLAVTFTALALVERLARPDGSNSVLAALLVVLVCSTLVVRRRHPLVAVAVLHYAPTGWSQRAVAVFRRAGPAVQTAALGSLLLVVDLLGPEGIPPFIYTRF